MVILLAVTASGAAREGIHNSAFEGGLHSTEVRPLHWNVGFPGDVTPFPGTWRLSRTVTAETSTTLEVECWSDEQACLFSQIVDLPAATMSGRLEESIAILTQQMQMDPENEMLNKAHHTAVTAAFCRKTNRGAIYYPHYSTRCHTS